MDIAHICCGVVGLVLLAGAVLALFGSCIVAGRCDDVALQPPVAPDLHGPDLDPLGAFGEQVDPDAVGHSA